MSYLRRILAVLGIGIAAAGPPSTSAQPTNPGKHWDATPDTPVSFGYKVCWLTIRTRDTAAVVRALRLKDARAANWKTGIAAAYEANLAFVAPALDGWTFVVGRDLPPPDGNGPGEPAGGLAFGHMFSKLSAQFPEVQFFGSHRVSGFVAWVRAKGGHVERVFSFADGTVFANFGPQSAEERALGFFDISGLAPDDAARALFAAAEARNSQQEDLVKAGKSAKEARASVKQTGRDPLPDEQDVVDLARGWSGIDPTWRERGHWGGGVGSVGVLRAGGDLSDP
jgi:hypothetical protein